MLIENLLVRLLSQLVNVFSESEVNEVKDFVDVGEYGLALDTIIDIINEESKSIPQEVISIAKEAAVSMGMDGSEVEDLLSDFVTQNQ